MCEYCKSCFADPNSDESMPTMIGDDSNDTVRTEKGYPLLGITVHLGYTYNLNNPKKRISRIEFNLHTVSEGADLANVDIPINYCPFCGTKLPEPSVSK